jgi:hypothetical protein
MASYLMRHRGMTLLAALRLIKSRRKFGYPNLGFLLQLMDLERAVSPTRASSIPEDALRYHRSFAAAVEALQRRQQLRAIQQLSRSKQAAAMAAAAVARARTMLHAAGHGGAAGASSSAAASPSPSRRTSRDSVGGSSAGVGGGSSIGAGGWASLSVGRASSSSQQPQQRPPSVSFRSQPSDAAGLAAAMASPPGAAPTGRPSVGGGSEAEEGGPGTCTVTAEIARELGAALAEGMKIDGGDGVVGGAGAGGAVGGIAPGKRKSGGCACM